MKKQKKKMSPALGCVLVLSIFVAGIIVGRVYQHLKTGYFYKILEAKSFPFFDCEVKLSRVSESIGMSFFDSDTSVITLEGRGLPIILYKAKQMAHESWPVVKNVCIEENRIIWNDGVNKYQLRVDLRQVRDDMDTEERNQVPDEIYKQYELSTLGELLSRPQDFDRKYVYVTGYYCGEFEGTALYRTLDDIRQMRHGKGIWVDAMLPFGEDGSFDYQREFDDQHVLAEGWFDIKRKGHLSGWPATLHVKHMSVLKKEDENHESGQEE